MRWPKQPKKRLITAQQIVVGILSVCLLGGIVWVGWLGWRTLARWRSSPAPKPAPASKPLAPAPQGEVFAEINALKREIQHLKLQVNRLQSSLATLTGDNARLQQELAQIKAALTRFGQKEKLPRSPAGKATKSKSAAADGAESWDRVLGVRVDVARLTTGHFTISGDQWRVGCQVEEAGAKPSQVRIVVYREGDSSPVTTLTATPTLNAPKTIPMHLPPGTYYLEIQCSEGEIIVSVEQRLL